MPFALEQPDVCVVTDDNIKIAVSAGFFKEPDMAGVKPVVTARDDHFFPARRGRQRRRFGKTLQFIRRENAVSYFVFGRKFLAGEICCGFVIRAEIVPIIYAPPKGATPAGHAVWWQTE